MLKSNLSCFTDYTKSDALIHWKQKVYWIFAQAQLSGIYRHELIVTYWALMKHQSMLTIQAKLKLLICTFVTFRSGKILAKFLQTGDKKGETEVMKRCSIQIYPTRFLSVLWKSFWSSTCIKFRVANVELLKKAAEHTLVSNIKAQLKRDIPKYFTQTGVTCNKNT